MADASLNPAPKVETHLPGRIVGIVVSVTSRDKGFVFLQGPDAVEYFSHVTGWQSEQEFIECAETQPVSFKVTETTKGLRAWDVRRPTDAERHLVDGWEDRVAEARAKAHREKELGNG